MEERTRAGKKLDLIVIEPVCGEHHVDVLHFLVVEANASSCSKTETRKREGAREGKEGASGTKEVEAMSEEQGGGRNMQGRGGGGEGTNVTLDQLPDFVLGGGEAKLKEEVDEGNALYATSDLVTCRARPSSPSCLLPSSPSTPSGLFLSFLPSSLIVPLTCSSPTISHLIDILL